MFALRKKLLSQEGGKRNKGKIINSSFQQSEYNQDKNDALKYMMLNQKSHWNNKSNINVQQFLGNQAQVFSEKSI